MTLAREADGLKGERAERRVGAQATRSQHEARSGCEPVVQTEPGQHAEDEATADVDDHVAPREPVAGALLHDPLDQIPSGSTDRAATATNAIQAVRSSPRHDLPSAGHSGERQQHPGARLDKPIGHADCCMAILDQHRCLDEVRRHRRERAQDSGRQEGTQQSMLRRPRCSSSTSRNPSARLPDMLVQNVAHGNLPGEVGRAWASSKRAVAPRIPPSAMTASTSGWIRLVMPAGTAGPLVAAPSANRARRCVACRCRGCPRRGLR